MTFRNRFLFIAFIIVSIVGLIQQWRNHNKTVDEYDTPKILSGVQETLLLQHIKRNCECADWIKFGSYPDSARINEEDFLFIEPATADLDVPASYWVLADSGYALRVQGEFYKGKAIPNNYISKADSKPAFARVFYYTSCEVVKPE